MDVQHAILTKRAVRQFQDKPLPSEVINSIVNAGRRAQSAKNMQPWHFIAVQDKAMLQALSVLGNWAGHLAGAALGVVLVTPPPEQRFSIMFDSGQAAAYMQLAALELGVGSCLATIYDYDKARELLGFPSEFQARVAISFGYPATEELLSRPSRKGGRHDLTEILHWEKW